MNYKEILLSNVLTQVKEKVIIDDKSDYKLVTISKTGDIKLREVVKGISISGKTMYRINEGDFIYSRLSVQSGAFGLVPNNLNNAVVTSEMPSFRISQTIDKEFLLYSLKLPSFQFQMEQLTKGVGRTRVKEKSFLTFKILMPTSLDKQKNIILKFKNIERINKNYSKEIINQKELISQLKQAILQEAIQGKLTQEWREQNPNTEPASELLVRIKTEKEQLIKDKKIRKEKPLPPITEDEIPFELPKNWVWCRGYYVAKYIDPQPSHRTPPVSKDGIPYVSMKDISKEGLINLNSARKVGKKILEEHRNRYQLEKDDFIFGKIGTIGNPVWLTEPFNYTLSANLILIQANREILNPKYFFYFLSSPHALSHLKDSKSEMSYPVFGMKKARLMPVILPPLEEQKTIVEKVETLMQKCNALEQEITQSEQHANMLMQAVLKEAFESKVIDN